MSLKQPSHGRTWPRALQQAVSQLVCPLHGPQFPLPRAPLPFVLGQLGGARRLLIAQVG